MEQKTHLYFDTEFTGLHKETTLISIGIVAEDARHFYAEFNDYDASQVDDWIQENVIDKLRFSPPKEGEQEFYIATRDRNNPIGVSIEDKYSVLMRGSTEDVIKELEKWLKQFEDVVMWSDCCAYDWVLFCSLFGHAFKVPKNIFYIPMDLSTLLAVKGHDPDISREEFAKEHLPHSSKKHNALWDAQVIKACVNKLDPFG